jgi:hypothetical protein
MFELEDMKPGVIYDVCNDYSLDPSTLTEKPERGYIWREKKDCNGRPILIGVHKEYSEIHYVMVK